MTNCKIFDNILNENQINDLINHCKNDCTHIDGQVGNRVNLNQKKRKDIFIKNSRYIEFLDHNVFEEINESINDIFNIKIKYRELWKVGYYNGKENSFYNIHTDDAGDTKYRKLSLVLMLSDKNDYEGGELYFPNLNINLKLEKGSLIIFNSELLHGVKEVTSGERYTLISFMFDNNGKQIKEKLNVRANINNYIPYLKKLDISYSSYERKDDFSNTQILGDIDYSDKYKNNLWTDHDDYYFENNNSETLLLSFAGMGWKDSLPTFIFYNFLKEYKTIDKLFLRDVTCRYYITGLRNTTQNFKSTIDFLDTFIKTGKYKKVIAFGCSAGGYAAILYGTILKINKVLSFSPQTVLTEKKEILIGDKYNAPKTCKWLSTLNKNNEEYQKALDLKNYLPFDTNIEIHYASRANHGSDKKHALYIESKNCKIIEHNSNNHMIALELKETNKLKKIIEDFIM